MLTTTSISSERSFITTHPLTRLVQLICPSCSEPPCTCSSGTPTRPTPYSGWHVLALRRGDGIYLAS